MLAGGQRLEDERAGRFQAADELDDHVDRRIVEDLGGVVHHRQRREVEALARADQIGVGHGGQREASARALLQHLAAREQDLGDAGPDGAEAQQPEADVLHLPRCLRPRSAWRMRCSFSTSAKRT